LTTLPAPYVTYTTGMPQLKITTHILYSIIFFSKIVSFMR